MQTGNILKKNRIRLLVNLLAGTLVLSSIIPALAAEKVNYFDLTGPTMTAQFRRWAYTSMAVKDWSIEKNSEFSGGYAMRLCIDAKAANPQTTLTWMLPVIFFDQARIYYRSTHPFSFHWGLITENRCQIRSVTQSAPAVSDGWGVITFTFRGDIASAFQGGTNVPPTDKWKEESGVRLLSLTVIPETSKNSKDQPMILLIDRMETLIQ
ncbi:MAG: hypothetical protein WC334_08375 [Kiritimatiellales bacterium]|jgi:hypothetical protein